MERQKAMRDSYYGLPVEYRIEKRNDRAGTHDTLILAYRDSERVELNYEHPPRRIGNWEDLQHGYEVAKQANPNALGTILEWLPEEIMKDFFEGFIGIKRKKPKAKKRPTRKAGKSNDEAD